VRCEVAKRLNSYNLEVGDLIDGIVFSILRNFIRHGSQREISREAILKGFCGFVYEEELFGTSMDTYADFHLGYSLSSILFTEISPRGIFYFLFREWIKIY